jgi:hypothetical protein
MMINALHLFNKCPRQGLEEIGKVKDQRLLPVRVCPEELLNRCNAFIILENDGIQERIENARSLFRNIDLSCHSNNTQKDVLNKWDLPSGTNLSIFVDEYDPSDKNGTNSFVQDK